MSVDFKQLTPGQLAKAAVVPQVLDNQWVPRELLNTMIQKGQNLDNIKQKRRKYIKKEWRRALVYGEQVIVNRAYIFNNDVVGDDYVKNRNRENFKTLLRKNVIVPFLWEEDSPDAKPHFAVRKKLWDAWLDVVNDTSFSCVRLGWGDQRNEFSRLSHLFHDYFPTLKKPERAEHLISSLGISSENVQPFRDRLVQIADYAYQKGQFKDIVRTDIYREFVCEDNSEITLGHYSQNKPFAAEIKQIADLKYNVNLPDLLGRYALTPEDSLPRDALGDLHEMVRENIVTENNVQEILYALKRLAFSQVFSGKYLKNLGTLTLPDVISTRASDEWAEYRDAVHTLLDDPLNFSESSVNVYRKFEQLNKTITRIHAESVVSKWEPWIKITMVLGTRAVELWINPTSPEQKFLTYAAGIAVSTGFVPFLMRLTVSALKRGNADLDLSLDFVRGTVSNGRGALDEIIGQLSSAPGIKVLDKSISEILDSNQSFPETKEK